eukprot:7051995-Alexandrium_andersonii.AAC.1
MGQVRTALGVLGGKMCSIGIRCFLRLRAKPHRKPQERAGNCTSAPTVELGTSAPNRPDLQGVRPPLA